MGHHLTVTRCCRLLQLNYAPYRNLHASTRIVGIASSVANEKSFGQALNVGMGSLFQKSSLRSIGKLWSRSILVFECDNLVTRY